MLNAKTLIIAGAMLAAAPAMAMETPPSVPPEYSGGSSSGGGATPVDAPPALMLFAMGFAGLVGGRVISRRRKKRGNGEG